MSDHTNGLRFDVYERVHLPDDVAAIDELEEIELVPRIQVIDQGDHAVLKGQLLLSGIYRSQNDSDAQLTLEHWIPVEITLPMNRITRLDDISIEIDNFDVDLLSARTLNVTGVLSLRGISAQPIFEQQEEAWKEEPFTVVHQRQPYDERLEEEFAAETDSSRQPYISEEGVQESEADFVYEQQQEWANNSDATVTISSSTTDSGWSSAQFFSPIVQRRDEEAEVEAESESEEEEEEEEEAREITYNSQITSDEGWLASSSQYVEAVESEPGRQEQERYEQWQQSERIANAQALYQQQQEQELEQELEPVQELEQEQEQEQEAVYDQVQYREPNQIAEQSPPEQEKQELRIALSGKQPEDNSGAAPNVGILTLLQSSRREQATRQAAEQVVAQQLADERARVQASGDEIEWQNLFLGKQSEDNDFRKIRVCIVQRDETLELIALRYSMKPREILLHNRLDESSVSEGQLLYIP